MSSEYGHPVSNKNFHCLIRVAGLLTVATSQYAALLGGVSTQTFVCKVPRSFCALYNAIFPLSYALVLDGVCSFSFCSLIASKAL